MLSALTFLGPSPDSDPDSEAVDGLGETKLAPYDPKRLFLIGHSCGAHILSCIFLDSSAITPSLIPSPALLAATRGIAVTEGIFDIDLLLASFPSYRSWFITNAFGDLDTYGDFSVTKYPLRDGDGHIHWLVVHSPNDTLVDVKQADAMYAHLTELELYSKHGDTVRKDVSTITSDHNDMLQSVQYSDFIGSWINSLHFH